MNARVLIVMDAEKFQALKKLLEDGSGGSDGRRLNAMHAYNDDADAGPIGDLVDVLNEANNNSANWTEDEA